MLWQYRLNADYVLEKRGIGFAEIQFYRVFAERFDGLDDAVVNPLMVMLLGVSVGKGNIVGSEIGAIMPLDVLLQFESIGIFALIIRRKTALS